MQSTFSWAKLAHHVNPACNGNRNQEVEKPVLLMVHRQTTPKLLLNPTYCGRTLF